MALDKQIFDQMRAFDGRIGGQAETGEGQNVMMEKIQEWKDAHKAEPRELDFDFFCQIVDRVNESSPVKVACNPTATDGNWIPGALCRNVSKATVDDNGRLTLHLRHDKEEMPADKLYGQIQKLKKKVAGGASHVMVQLTEEKSVRLTDAYSHSLVNEHWAGLPFDLVFAYFDEDKRPEHAIVEDSGDREGE